MWRRLSTALVLTAALACAKPPAGPPQSDPRTGLEPECMTLPAVRLYLESLRKAVTAKWVVPEDSAGHRSMLRMMLDESGGILNASIVGAPRDPANVSALRALNAAAPFGPIPEAARCLDHNNITVTVVAPEAAQVAPAPRR